MQKRPETAAETTLPGNKATQGEFWHSLDSSQINAHRRPDPGLHQLLVQPHPSLALNYEQPPSQIWLYKKVENLWTFSVWGGGSTPFHCFWGCFPNITEPILDDENITKCQNSPSKSDHFTSTTSTTSTSSTIKFLMTFFDDNF